MKNCRVDCNGLHDGLYWFFERKTMYESVEMCGLRGRLAGGLGRMRDG